MVRKGKVSRALGAHGERLAARYLEASGFQIIERNWRCARGELDIVAYEPAARSVVVVEVKTKTGLGFGTPLESITHVKARRLYQLARMWVDERSLGPTRVRVDGVGVLLAGREPEITHIRGISA